MTRLWRTTAFAFTIVYLLVFAGAVGLLGFFFYQATFVEVDRQTDSIIDQEVSVLAEVFSIEGAGVLRRVIRERAAWRDDGLYMLINAPSGAVLAGNLTALPPEALTAGEGFFDFTFERTRVDAAGREMGTEAREARGKIRRFRASPDAQISFLVFVARDVSGREALRQRSQALMTQIITATIFLGLLIGIGFSQWLLRRVDAVNRTALAIRGGDLSKRIALSGSDDEFDTLSENLNAMLDQIERLMTGMREVSDNIAHDLRSPLNRIKVRLSNALDAGLDEKDRALQATLDDADRMITTFNALLSIARIESGEGAGAMEPVDLAAIAEEMAELYEPAADDAGFVLALSVSPAPPVRGSRALISQAVANMLDNALKYAEGGTKIELTVSRSPDGRVILKVADDGPGIPEKNRSEVVKRFVRLEESRTTPGSGLGLSLVGAIARAHSATLTLRETNPDTDRPGLSIALSFRPEARR
ncbi:MAG: HAMP domain-containing sensor histidine kinase [Pseudomonadota bacterium]